MTAPASDTPTPDAIPEGALREAVARLNAERRAQGLSLMWGEADHRSSAVRVLARLIAKHETPPVHPLLIEAREAAAQWLYSQKCPNVAVDVRAGKLDKYECVQVAASALANRDGIPLDVVLGK